MKIHIYQIFVRLFGNKISANKINGSIEENGCGKFNDISDVALDEIKKLGMSHVWYTGVLEHASLTAYPKAGIAADHPDFVKGKAGSPYAIRDYFDVCPDLAVDANKRMREFEQLLQRTHKKGLKALIDFVPNHVSRAYKSDNKPIGEEDLGEQDDPSKAFSTKNNFYYLPGQDLVLPKITEGFEPFKESPAKVTGNDCFTSHPSVNDWYETVKLNYGVDYLNEKRKYFLPVPDTWHKMTHILLYWAGKGVDGFRCDMAEMVPVEFWQHAITSVKKKFPQIIFIAEVYDPKQYHNYIHQGGFDLLYDKVGLYDTLKGIIQGHKWANDITTCWQNIDGIKEHVLNFLENHDEQRIASRFFAGDPWRAIPALIVSSCMEKSSYMQYFAQELGESATDAEGFSGPDGRTTIFDYWGVKEHQKWMNDGLFDGGQLSDISTRLRETYQQILTLALSNPVIQKGDFYDLQWANRDNPNYNNQYIYSFLRYTKSQCLLFVVNFSNDKQSVIVSIPEDALTLSKKRTNKKGSILFSTNQNDLPFIKGQEFNLDGNGVLILSY